MLTCYYGHVLALGVFSPAQGRGKVVAVASETRMGVHFTDRMWHHRKWSDDQKYPTQRILSGLYILRKLVSHYFTSWIYTHTWLFHWRHPLTATWEWNSSIIVEISSYLLLCLWDKKWRVISNWDTDSYKKTERGSNPLLLYFNPLQASTVHFSLDSSMITENLKNLRKRKQILLMILH